MEVVERSAFRVTRDADLDVSDEADDLLEEVELQLRQRRFGEVARLEVSSSISQALSERLQLGLRVSDDLVYPITGTLDLADAMELTQLDRPDLKVDSWTPLARPPLSGLDADDQFATIRAADFVVHHPYDSFTASFESFLNASADDPKVIALKSTVYRTGDDTPLVPALIEASEHGKQSVCLVEIKARGDERRNIEWSRALEQAGVHVVYGFPTLKIHATMTLVVPPRRRQLPRMSISARTGHNRATARGYERLRRVHRRRGDRGGCRRPVQLPHGLRSSGPVPQLLVAPFGLRQRLVEEIRGVADAARAGLKARIRIKVNGLTHVEVIDELYAASEAGARIDLLVRGVCSLRPGIPGLSENIRVRSVLGRFLEHSRLFVFEAGDRSLTLLGSADMMPRNLDHRVEVLMPVDSIAIQSEIAATLDTLLADTASSWELEADGSWHRIRPKKEERPRSAQATLMRRARRRVFARAFADDSKRVKASSDGNLRCDEDACRVLDVGSNTTRLLVARVERGTLVPVDKAECGSRSARRSSASAPSRMCTSPRTRRRCSSLRSAPVCIRSSRSTSS